MTIKKALIYSNKKLKPLDPNYIEGSLLLSFCLGKNKEYLYAHPEQRLIETQLKNFEKLIIRRLKKEPLAYLIKQKEFYDLNFYVDKNVLIPRPETELIINEVLKIITNNQKPITIADIGTGSGCIAIALAKLLAKAKITAVDISSPALKIAKKNAKRHNVFEKIKFLQSDLLSFKDGKKSALADFLPSSVIIANLPYLTKKELTNVPFEPQKALFGGKNGLEIVEKFLRQISKLKYQPQTIFLEISPTQTNKIKNLVNKYLPDKRIKFIKDLNSQIRLIKIL